MILSVIIAVIIYLIDAVIQAFLIERKGIWINHAISWAVGLFYCLGTSYYFNSGIEVFTVGVVLGSLRWILFDLFLNIWRGKDWNYIGELDGKDANTDKLLHKLPNPEYSQYIIKFGLLFITILLYLIL